MKKWLLLIVAAVLLSGCVQYKDGKPVDEPAKKEEVKKEAVKEEKPEPEAPAIDTSVYEYATDVAVTDARDVNDHITLIIDMPTDNPGLAFQHVLNQTYDFLQQSDIEGAKTIGVNVNVKGNKVGMFTVRPEEFKPNDDEPMSDVVLEASEIEMMSPDVEAYGKTMGSW